MTAVKGIKFGLIVPSTNTAVEKEFNWIRPRDLSWHTGRILIREPKLDSDATFEAFLEDLRSELGNAIESVMTCKPDYLVMGMSAETFWGGVRGNEEFERSVRELSGLEVTTGASGTKAALDLFGARKIGVITPYQPVGDAQVQAYFEEMGFAVNGVYGLKSSSATSIADESPEKIRAAFLSVDGPDVDVLVQAGTNLEAVKVAAELEKELGKPVIAINLATIWHALRANGIDDRIEGYGSLLERF